VIDLEPFRRRNRRIKRHSHRSGERNVRFNYTRPRTPPSRARRMRTKLKQALRGRRSRLTRRTAAPRIAGKLQPAGTARC